MTWWQVVKCAGSRWVVGMLRAMRRAFGAGSGGRGPARRAMRISGRLAPMLNSSDVANLVRAAAAMPRGDVEDLCDISAAANITGKTVGSINQMRHRKDARFPAPAFQVSFRDGERVLRPVTGRHGRGHKLLWRRDDLTAYAEAKNAQHS